MALYNLCMTSFGKAIKIKLSSLPASPGVYQFLDDKQGVIYIGKAKNLRSRVRQYFQGNDERPQIPFLMKEAADFIYTVVNTELESLYLERTLIQKHRPKYNIELKDDKAYAFIVIDYSTEVPQVVIKRRVSEDKSEILISKSLPRRQAGETNPKSKNQISKPLPKTQHLKPNTYFGPYTSAKKIRDLIFMARRTFGLCSAAKIGKPCFYYHLHRCPGVCAGVISITEYKKHLDKIKLFFSGKISSTIKNIKADMAKAAKKKQFEKAARLRDQIRALMMLKEKQNMILPKPENWDIIGLAISANTACINLFKIRQGKMLGKENFIYRSTKHYKSAETHRTDTLQQFLEQYYLDTSDIPKTIYIPASLSNSIELDTKIIQTIIQNRFHKNVKINISKKGKAKQLADLSKTNAEEYLKNWLLETGMNFDKTNTALVELKNVLNLPKIPQRIECYDISNTQGTNPVGSMVVFENGLPKKSDYRKFKIQSKTTPDDFEMMKEMLARRMSRSSKNQVASIKENWPLPDLIVIDGGKGQLSAALAVLQATSYKLQAIPIVGLAKRIEEIFLPEKSKPIILNHDQPGLQLLQRLRDEAHRFGISFHRSLRSKQAIKSALDDIPGIGPKTKKLLKNKFGSLVNITQASEEQLSHAVGKKLATRLKENL